MALYGPNGDLLPVGYGTQSLADVIGHTDIVAVDVEGGYILGTQKLGSPAVASGIPVIPEVGTTSSQFSTFLRDEYNPELRGNQGLVKYDRMRRSDAQVRTTLRLIKSPILSARWFVEPATSSRQDQKIADFIWDNLTKWMSISWENLIREALLMLDFGFYMFERVFEFRSVKGWNSPRLIWKKLAPRHPLDLESWNLDANGGPEGAWFYGPNGSQQYYLDINKLVIFTYEGEAGNLEGFSLLRTAYKHWYFKENLYKIDAIQKERHGMGVPLIKLPPGFTAQDRNLANELGRNLRSNEKAHVVLPPNWDILFLKLEGHPVDALASAEHHDLLLARNVLGQFININVGNVTQSEQQGIFMRNAMYIADTIRSVFNKYLIPQLVMLNWGSVDEFPELRVRRIGETVDWRTISFALRNLIGAGAIRPDDNVEAWARENMDLPKADPATARFVPTPQGAPDPEDPTGGNAQARVGPPRQSRPSTKGTGNKSSGQDGSGGK
jgi:hypothetical protein